MGKLTNLKPAVAVVPQRLGRMTDEHGHSDANEPWRRWYHSKRWRGSKAGGWLDGLRGRILMRDGFVCQRCERLIVDKAKAIAHHIKAHRGDPVLFWDPGNLQCVCNECHSGPIAAEEARQRAQGLL